jgi:hypothetical protein
VDEQQEGGDKYINAKAMKGMEHFANHWEAKKLSSWHVHCLVSTASSIKIVCIVSNQKCANGST